MGQKVTIIQLMSRVSHQKRKTVHLTRFCNQLKSIVIAVLFCGCCCVGIGYAESDCEINLQSIFKLFGEVADEIFNRDTHLSHGVALADGDAVVFKRVEVHGDAIGSADLVLTAVSLAD